MTTKPEITAALATADADVPVPTPGTFASFQARVDGMAVDAIVSSVQGIDCNVGLSELVSTRNAACERIRNNVGTAVTRAKARTGGTYEIEVTPVLMPSMRCLILAVVTRTK